MYPSVLSRSRLSGIIASDKIPIRDSNSESNRQGIFCRLHSAITEQANNSYVRSFLNVVEWIRQSGHNPEELHFELHETERPAGGQHTCQYIFKLLQKYLSCYIPENKCYLCNIHSLFSLTAGKC